MIRIVKRVIVIMLIMALSITTMPELKLTAFAAGKSKRLYEKDGIEVEFKVNSKWETGFEGQLILMNNSVKPLENWRLRFSFNHEIASLWDGEIESHSANEYVIKHPAWNPTVPAGGKVVIGFNGNCNGTLEMPFACTVPTGIVETPEEDYSVTYKTTSDWGDAFNGEIAITNHTKKAMENWKLEHGDLHRNRSEISRHRYRWFEQSGRIPGKYNCMQR